MCKIKTHLMVKVKDKTGREIEVNNFVGSNETLLKKYGYTLVTPTPEKPKEEKKEEKKSVNPAAASDKEKSTTTVKKTEAGI